jgi:transcriptional regulator with XRE-family HTH domain
MDAIRVGLSLRALRIRRGWRQIDVARRAGVSRGAVSALERGHFGGFSLHSTSRVASALDADLDVRLRWRGAELDRLLDEGHARLVNLVAGRLRNARWEVAIETTFSHYGERGSIDLLAFHGGTASLLVVEVKTVVPDFQAMVAALDRKARIAPNVARSRGWQARFVGRLLVVEEGSTSRDRISRLAAATAAAFPHRGAVVRAWLAAPSNSMSGLIFVRSATHASRSGVAAGRQRVRIAKASRNATQVGASQVADAGGERQAR